MANLFDPPSSDVSMQWLGSIFGGMGLFGGSGGDPIAGANQVLIGAILIAVGVLFTYFLLVGVMNTAQEGSILGKKWPVWIFPRMSTAVALMLPVIKGYAMIQIIVAWLLVQGIGLADKGVEAFVDNQNLAQTLTSSFSKSPVKTTAYNLFLSSVCMATLEQGVKQQGTSVIYTSPSIGITTEKQGNKTFYYFGDKNESAGMTKQTCGYYVVDSSQINMQGSSLVSASDLSGANDINQAQQAQIGSLVSAMMNAGRSLVSSHKAIPASTIDSAIADYQKAIQQSAFDAVKKMNDNKEMQDNIKKDGWIMLGFWYPKIQAMSSQINKAINNVAVATGPSSFDSDLLKDEYVQNMTLAMETVRNGGGIANYGIAKQVDNSGSLLDKIKGWTKSFSIEGAIKNSIDFQDYTIQKGADPMLNLMTYGGICLTAAGVGFVAILALMGTVGNAPGVGLALQSVLLMFVPLLALVGITLLYILPLIPTLIWVGCISGFILMAIEAIIASLFWGLMILNPNGNHEVIGAGQQGFRLIVALLFKPFLLVVGFWVSILMMNTLGTWVSDMFAYIFDLSQSDSNVFTYIVGKIISPVLYGSIMLVVIKKIFGIVPALPDELIKWIGGGSTGFTGHSKETSGSEATGSANVVAGAVINAGAQAGKDVNGKGDNGNGKGPQIKNDERGMNGGSSGSSAGFARMMEQQKSGPNGYDSMMKNRRTNSSGSASAGSPKSSKGVSAESSSNGSESVSSGVSGDEVMETGNTVDDPHSGVGEVMEFGEAPYKNDDANNKSYFVSLKQDDGQVKQIWGADLRNQNFQVGEKVSISKSGVLEGQEFQTKEGKNISHKNMFNVERLNKE
ncbi:DotA/TraY family protein [Burkholderia cenocepacia]|uniref:DotA/TraY family protein n=1 Tax=Burkholderia cenocepacia TaxID=95486 RepID=UPI0020A1CCAE|nr:DotA/TraY family protein [Burkholderia cenocepacia]MCO8326771.1 DotA/TraY family protein [Burkholderia cenocepacia]MCO8333834.1 DotA/TraY family protein [Burkholderia cenocepacia]MCO8341207.1 DotA/TraY family protein [Burkholderia cenocepacia]MCO8348627.1 DotA/TraY family protein [Burkholderia cenocepacia]MCO8361819.1 DotA/TraY family protein [Burkholderia cenocepacia]